MGYGQICSDENLNLPKLISIVRPEIKTYIVRSQVNGATMVNLQARENIAEEKVT